MNTSTKIRMNEQVARRAVRDFKVSSLSQAWNWIADRSIIIDAVVMNEIRAAWVGDSQHGFTADEIMAFRKMVTAELAAKGWRE